VSTLFANAHVVTMDDGGTEHEAGWILVDEGLVEDAGGEAVVRNGQLVRGDEEEIAREHRAQPRRFAP
jgi:hypothetical protein